MMFTNCVVEVVVFADAVVDVDLLLAAAVQSTSSSSSEEEEEEDDDDTEVDVAIIWTLTFRLLLLLPMLSHDVDDDDSPSDDDISSDNIESIRRPGSDPAGLLPVVFDTVVVPPPIFVWQNMVGLAGWLVRKQSRYSRLGRLEEGGGVWNIGARRPVDPFLAVVLGCGAA
jgi:hypothetical protein